MSFVKRLSPGYGVDYTETPPKRHLSVQRFQIDEAVVADVKAWFDGNFFGGGIFTLVHRWDKCINLFGDYVEK